MSKSHSYRGFLHARKGDLFNKILIILWVIVVVLYGLMALYYMGYLGNPANKDSPTPTTSPTTEPSDPNLPLDPNAAEDTIDRGRSLVEDIRSGEIKTKLKEAGEKAKENKAIGKVDSFLEKISLAFRIIFGSHYSFSLKFLIIIILWIIMAIILKNAIQAFSNFSDGTAIALAFFMTIIIAQLQLFSSIAWLLSADFLSQWPMVQLAVATLILITLIAFVILGLKELRRIRKIADAQLKQAAERARRTREQAARNAFQHFVNRFSRRQ